MEVPRRGRVGCPLQRLSLLEAMEWPARSRSERDEIMMSKKEVVEVYGPAFNCFGNPFEGCLKNYSREPCKTCIELFRPESLERLRFYEKRG